MPSRESLLNPYTTHTTYPKYYHYLTLQSRVDNSCYSDYLIPRVVCLRLCRMLPLLLPWFWSVRGVPGAVEHSIPHWDGDGSRWYRLMRARKGSTGAVF